MRHLHHLQEHIESSDAIPPAQFWQIPLAGILLLIGLSVLFLPGGLTTGFYTLQAYSLPFPALMWEYITFSGDKWPILAMGLALSLRYPRFTLAMLFAGVIGILMTQGLKLYFHTARPPATLAHDSFRLIGSALTANSTPSGHTATAFLAAGLVTHLCQSRVAQICALLLAALIGYSRIAVGVHWPVDVLTGASAGLFCSWLGVSLANRLQAWFTPWLFIIIVLLLFAATIRLLTYNGGFAHTDLFAVSIAAACLGMFYSDLRRTRLARPRN